jgi:hypothetical protein
VIRPLALLGIAVVMTLVYTAGHAAGATGAYTLAKADYEAQSAASRDAAERMMSDAYIDNAVLRDRLEFTQRQLQEARSLLAVEHERAEQASAERDRARSRLGIYERSTWEPPLILDDALLPPRPGTSTPQLH